MDVLTFSRVVLVFLIDRLQATHCLFWAARRQLYSRRLLPVTGRSQLAGGGSRGFWPEASFLLPSPCVCCIFWTNISYVQKIKEIHFVIETYRTNVEILIGRF